MVLGSGVEAGLRILVGDPKLEVAVRKALLLELGDVPQRFLVPEPGRPDGEYREQGAPRGGVFPVLVYALPGVFDKVAVIPMDTGVPAVQLESPCGAIRHAAHPCLYVQIAASVSGQEHQREREVDRLLVGDGREKRRVVGHQGTDRLCKLIDSRILPSEPRRGQRIRTPLAPDQPQPTQGDAAEQVEQLEVHVHG